MSHRLPSWAADHGANRAASIPVVRAPAGRRTMPWGRVLLMVGVLAGLGVSADYLLGGSTDVPTAPAMTVPASVTRYLPAPTPTASPTDRTVASPTDIPTTTAPMQPFGQDLRSRAAAAVAGAIAGGQS